MTYITDVADAVVASDAALDLVIEAYLAGRGSGVTAEAWRLENYAQLRAWAYPAQTDYLDAVVKINSGDQVLAGRGWTELGAYYQACLAVKRRFPKPHEDSLGDFPVQDLRGVFVNAAQAHMDSVVSARRVFGDPDGKLALLSCCTYATSSHPMYGPDGRAAVQWRDDVWQRCEEIYTEVVAGRMSIPTIDEFVAMLPPMVWPS
jgi:hypothetical protein